MTSNDTIDDLLNQALDAHKSIGAIDFDAVSRHDDAALAQVDHAITNLQALEDTTSPQAKHQRSVLNTLERARLAGRVGHLFSDRSGLGDDGMLGYDETPHLDGLPPFEVVVAPDFSPVPGLHGLFVTRKGIASASLAMPLADNRWTIHQTEAFNSPEHMVMIMARLMAAPDSNSPAGNSP